MWVGKFETGYKGATIAAEAEKNENNSSKIQIKPNVYSWRNINVSNAYLNSYEYKRSLDSHLMKNTEWGAVAYLQHSKYGSKENLRINNYNEYKTGYSVVKIPECGYTGTNEECNRYETDESVTRPWNTEAGYYASTTNNSSGIYDMSGGAWEYVMGVLSKDGIPCIGRDELLNSGFNGSYCYTSEFFDEGVTFPNDKRYYDVYEYSDVDEQYERRVLGDATGEMGPFTMEPYGSQKRQIGSWHGDEGWFVNSWAPWFIRGGLFAMGTGAGIFSYAHEHGPAGHHCGFRIVLSI